MNKNLLLLIASVTASVLLGLGLLRWLAPELFGGSVSLRLVRSSDTVPPFFDNLFRRDDFTTAELLLNDPVAIVRGRPLFPASPSLGPHDLLGFRNTGVPNLVDVLVIGDSQTYGNNAPLARNWPSVMQKVLAGKDASVYAMAVGGWGAVQYLDILSKAMAFLPRVVVVAFYSGNDPLDSFAVAYGDDRWAKLRPDPNLTARDAPKVVSPAPAQEQWTAALPTGLAITFTPNLRLNSNQDHPAVDAGWGVMWRVAEEIERLVAQREVALYFTVVPTKELVYAPLVGKLPDVPPAYRALLAAEQARIGWLRERIQGLATARYIDTVGPLQAAVLDDPRLYPSQANGHPTAAGYRVIGEAVASVVIDDLPAPRRGLYLLDTGAGYSLVLISGDGFRSFASEELAEVNGWPPGEYEVVSGRDLGALSLLGVITDVDPGRYGPAAH